MNMLITYKRLVFWGLEGSIQIAKRIAGQFIRKTSGRLRASSGVLALCGAVALTGCGGGNSADGDSKSRIDSFEVSSSTDITVNDGADIAATLTARIQAFVDGQAPRWVDESMCKDGEFVGPLDDLSLASREMYLFNRHKLCARFTVPTYTIRLELMQDKKSSTWQLYDGKAKDDALFNYKDFDYGDVTLEHEVAAYGRPNVLEKQYALRIRVARFVFNGSGADEFPISSANGQFSLKVSPKLFCGTNGAGGRWSCLAENIALSSVTVGLREGGAKSVDHRHRSASI